MVVRSVLFPILLCTSRLCTASGVESRAVTGVAATIQGPESLMSPRLHGTCLARVQTDLRWGSSAETANRICCFNRHYAEHSGYFQQTAFFRSPEARKAETDGLPIIFYDSVTGSPLFRAPVGRTWAQFKLESIAHGWPSFRDAEVITSHVRILANGEAVSTDGTHLGHNLPDSSGNRYCINIVSVAGRPSAEL